MKSRSRKAEVITRKSLVPPLVAAVASAVVPGLGQLLGLAWRRGLLLIASFATILGLLVWRVRLAARYDTEIIDIIFKAFRLRPVLLIISIFLAILYIFVILDAYRQAQRPPRRMPGVFALVLIVFFGLGWQIGKIDPVTLITETQRGSVVLKQVVWPWQAATTRLTDEQVATARIQVPCPAEPLANPAPAEDRASLLVEPNCGVMTSQEGEVGTLLSLNAAGFEPGVAGEVWWRDPLGNQFRQRIEGSGVLVTPDENGTATIEVPIPYRLIPPSAAEGPQTWIVELRQSVATGELVPSESLLVAIERMIETIFLGMMATAFGIVLSLPISFAAARNLMGANWFTLSLYYLVRLVLNIIRSIEPMIWAVIAIIVVGLGPFAGIVALTIHTIAALGKLYSESIESIDPGPIEAIQATGANWLQTVMYAVVPQIIPPFVSFTIYRWDINVRMSTVIGLVGGGGIGFVLIQWIRLFDYQSAGIAVWFIAITVAILDFVSAEIRRRFI